MDAPNEFNDIQQILFCF